LTPPKKEEKPQAPPLTTATPLTNNKAELSKMSEGPRYSLLEYSGLKSQEG